MPSPAAIRPPVSSTIEGRIRFNSAITSAAIPNTEFLNSAVAERAPCRSWSAVPASQASATGENSIAQVAHVQRITDGDEADDHQELDLVRGEAERRFCHRGTMVGNGVRGQGSGQSSEIG